MKILFTHGYFIGEDQKELQIMRPYVPLGILYISSYLEKHGFENDVFDSLVGLCQSAKLISNIGHEVGLWLTRDISIEIACSNNCIRWIRYVVASTRCTMSGIGDPAIGSTIAVWERVIELFSELLTGFTQPWLHLP